MYKLVYYLIEMQTPDIGNAEEGKSDSLQHDNIFKDSLTNIMRLA